MAMFSIAAWSMFAIYELGKNQYHDAGVLYCTYYLLISLIISAALLVLQCAIIFGKIAVGMARKTMGVFLVVIVLFYLLVVCNLRYVSGDVFPEIVNSSIQYFILMIANSFVVMFAIWRAQPGELNR